jgi:hypothetical protein
MTPTDRHLAIKAFSSGPNPCAYVAAVFLILFTIAGPASAADPTRPTRLHRTTTAQSAGSADVHGKVQPAKPATRHGNASAKSHATTPKHSAAKEPEKADAAPSKSRTRSRHRKNAQPEMVDDPVTMYRTDSRHTERIPTRQQAVAPHASAPPVHTAAAPKPTDPADPKKILTVDDFMRAAGATTPQQTNATNPPQPKSQVIDQGVSHPDDDPIEVSAAKPTPAKPRPVVATTKPAPIVRATPAPIAEVSAAGVSYDDAPHSADLPNSKVVQGFGGEVEILPHTSPAKPATHHNDDLADDGLTQRELTEDAIKPMVVPIYTRTGKLLVPPPLKGTHEILVHQNLMADNEGLTRIQDDEDLDRMRAAHLLVAFPDMAGLEVNEELPYNRRYARPWTVKFTADTARAFYSRFHEPLHLNSAVRTVDYQLRLQRINGNAAAVDGDVASPHLTGQAIDLGKHGMTVAEISWMRQYLMPLIQSGKVDVEEEFQQACFHISVYEGYWPAKKHLAPKTEVAQLRGEPAER